MTAILFFDRLTYETLREAKVNFDLLSERTLGSYLSAMDMENLRQFNQWIIERMPNIFYQLGLNKDDVQLRNYADLPVDSLPKSIEDLPNQPLDAHCCPDGQLILWPMSSDESPSPAAMDVLSINTRHETNDMLRYSVANVLTAMTRVMPLKSVLASKQFGMAVSIW